MSARSRHRSGDRSMILPRINSFLCGVCCLAVLAFNSYSQQPVNDDFAERTVLSGTNLVISAGNAGATRQPGEPDHANREGGASVWWTWQAPASGEVTITTEGSTFD